MKKYYLHNGIESSGPFDLSELKIKQITPTTPVWFSGIPDWKTASEIDELQAILTVTPPPFQSVPPTPTRKEKKSKIMGLHKNTFYIVSVLLLLIIGSFILNIIDENRQIEFERKNNKTERENRQFQLQEKEIQEQKQRIAEQEKLETERIANERKETINTKLSEIQIKQIENQTRLEDVKNKLVKATQFQIFRTPDEKNKELNALQTEINQLKKDIEAFENERNQLSLEQERMQSKPNQ